MSSSAALPRPDSPGRTMHLAELAIRRPVTATVASLLLIILGLVSLGRLSVREYPNVDRPTISINTAYRGASAAIIENKITQPIEDQIAGLEGISRIDSESEDERSSSLLSTAMY